MQPAAVDPEQLAYLNRLPSSKAEVPGRIEDVPGRGEVLPGRVFRKYRGSSRFPEVGRGNGN